MEWRLRNKATKDTLRKRFISRESATLHLETMGSAFCSLYEAVPDTDNQWEFRALTEGLVRGDLRHIILPQVSVDEYVPSDPDTDHIVFAFFIKGVPEAVIPFRDFVSKCEGVIDVSYGDSDTIVNTSIVYVEMNRNNFRHRYLRDIMEQICLLSELEVDDFSVTFPTSSKKYPYSDTLIKSFFKARSAKKNMLAQQKAIQNAEKAEEAEAENAEQGSSNDQEVDQNRENEREEET